MAKSSLRIMHYLVLISAFALGLIVIIGSGGNGGESDPGGTTGDTGSGETGNGDTLQAQCETPQYGFVKFVLSNGDEATLEMGYECTGEGDFDCLYHRYVLCGVNEAYQRFSYATPYDACFAFNGKIIIDNKVYRFETGVEAGNLRDYGTALDTPLARGTWSLENTNQEGALDLYESADGSSYPAAPPTPYVICD
jgi:hypothetical protein